VSGKIDGNGRHTGGFFVSGCAVLGSQVLFDPASV
jgi:hypothetical protein